MEETDNLEQSSERQRAVEDSLEEAILEYAISAFPYAEALELIPGCRPESIRNTLFQMIDEGTVKVGFYYEEMQENLTLFYFLCVEGETHIVFGLDPNHVQVSITTDTNGIFRINDEQYLDILQVPLN
jgi:hypothetical protein